MADREEASTNETETERATRVGFRFRPETREFIRFSAPKHRAACPMHCPQSEDAMGTPLSIDEAARVIGVSPWTVRQTLMPRGLPYFRSGRGKLIFYTNQIVGWIKDQQKGVL